MYGMRAAVRMAFEWVECDPKRGHRMGCVL